MTPLTVTILPGGVTAKEVNPVDAECEQGFDVHEIGGERWEAVFKRWIEAQRKLRTFDLSGLCGKACSPACEFPCEKPGTIHNAELLPNGKIKIV